MIPPKYLEEFSFEIPKEQIAKFPVEKREGSRLFVAKGMTDYTLDYFYNIEKYLQEEDLLVLNNTKVECRRVYLQSTKREIVVESLFLERLEKNKWKVLLKHARKFSIQDSFVALHHQDYQFQIANKQDNFVILETSKTLDENDFAIIGNIPIPPYLKRDATVEDLQRYQSVFAKHSGSVAAPTASLHFTKDLLSSMQKAGVQVEELTLHINYGTFSPLQPDNFANSKLHKEQYCVPDSLFHKLKTKQYKRLFAVGTTTLRVLEHLFLLCKKNYHNLSNQMLNGYTEQFFYPPYKISSIDFLLTNFHLSQSSLFLLICCLQNKENIHKFYQTAIQEKFRFYSYGDAMLLTNQYKQ